MGTNKGDFAGWTAGTFAVTTYTQTHGLLANEFNRFHWLKLPGRTGNQAASERIIMGGLEGITSFDPAKVGEDTYDPPVALTGLLVDNQPADPA